MKLCPQCGNTLPEESHFCPKCMYEYEKVETVVPEIAEKYADKKKWNIGIWGVIAVCIAMLWGLILSGRKKEPTSNETPDNSVVAEQIKLFRTEADINDQVEVEYTIKYDMRNALPDITDLVEFLGEPVDVSVFSGHTQYVYGDVEILLDEDKVYDILIDYVEADSLDEYGLYGICGKTTKDEVRKILGTPNQDYGNEYDYYFDGMARGPMLKIWFDSDNNVECIEYYTTL